MKKLQRYSGLVLLSGLVLVGLTACTVYEQPAPPPPPPAYAPAPPPEPVYSYYYYPESEVYFDPGRHFYFWLDAGVWRSGPALPRGFVFHPESRVTVRLSGREPYLHHAEIRARYPRHHREEDRR